MMNNAGLVDQGTTDVTADTGAPAAAGERFGVHGAGGNAPRIYFIAGDGHVHELSWTGNGWATTDVTADTGAPAAAGERFGVHGAGHAPASTSSP